MRQGEILRKLVKLSEFKVEEVAAKLDLSRQQLYNLYEKNELPEHYKKILRQNGIDVDKSLQNVLQESQAPYNISKVDWESRGNMIIVPLKAFGGFLTGYADKAYLDTLERTSFPLVRGECFLFEVEGHSMVNDEKGERSYPQGSHVVCTPLEQLTWMVKNKDYVFQCVDGIILKTFNEIKGEYCHISSLNKEYEPVKIHLKKIKRVYHIEKQIL